MARKPASSPAPSPPPGPGAAARFNRIVRMEVAGGFLDGLALDFDPHLSCIIGGKGTGKSTAFELLRFALLGSSSKPASQVGWALQEGQVKVLVETRDGSRYWVERTLHSGPDVSDAEGKPVKLPAARVLDVHAFGQGELEKVADSPDKQLALLDRFATAELDPLEQQLAEVESALRANADAIDRLTHTVRKLEDETARLPELTRRLEELPEVGGAHAATIQEELAGKGARDRELIELARLEGGVAEHRRLLEEGRGVLAMSLDPHPEDLLAGANGPVLGAARRIVQEAASQLQRLHDQALAALEEARRGLRAQRQALERLHAEQDARYREVLALQAREKGLAHERVAVQREVYELELRVRERQERERELEARWQARQALLARLSNLRDERTAVRRRTAEHLTRRLAPSIRVSITAGAGRTAYRELIDQALKEVTRNVGALVKAAVGSSRVPSEVARMVRAGARDELGAAFNLKPDRAEVFFQALQAKPAIWQVETCDLEDLPTIELLHEGQWREASTLSSGLRCTALLPLLLLEGINPLLVDQPEDDLDGATIVAQVVSRVLEVKPGRQLLFVTHNANLVVIGAAERVLRLALTAEGKQAHVLAAGSADDLRKHIEDLLEGGREAFRTRMRHYER